MNHGDTSEYCESDWTVSFRSGDRVVSSGSLLRTSRESVTFEIHGAPLLLRTSEVLGDFKVVMKNQSLYSGDALLTSVIQSATSTTCEASLSGAWQVALPTPADSGRSTEALFTQWDAHRRVQPRFKLAVADLQCFLTELRMWLDEQRLAVAVRANGDLEEVLRDLLDEVLPAVSPTLDGLFERFEASCTCVEADARAAHRVYLRRMLHPLLLACPFMHRIFCKPLGYAGDYEMMNMIWRNDFEGHSLLGKMLNRYIVNQAPGVSVRQRVDYMTRTLTEETARAASLYGGARIYSVGCGPAREVQNFLTHPVSKRSQFLLLDFNEETLSHARERVEEASHRSGGSASVEYVKKSAHYLLREGPQTASPGADGYDLVYSSGLYDYLNDRMCTALNSYLYGLLRPGGVLVVTNFTPANPIRNVMEFMFEWFLIHRDSRQMQAIAPTQAHQDDCVVRVDSTGCNAFLEVRKPHR